MNMVFSSQRTLVVVLSLVMSVVASESIESGTHSLVKRGQSYVEEGLYACHKSKNVQQAEDLHRLARSRIKLVFRKKRDAVEVNQDQVTEDDFKVLSQVLQMKQKITNYSSRHAATTYCNYKNRFLSKGIAKEVGCADEADGTTLFIVCLYRVEF